MIDASLGVSAAALAKTNVSKTTEKLSEKWSQTLNAEAAAKAPAPASPEPFSGNIGAVDIGSLSQLSSTSSASPSEGVTTGLGDDVDQIVAQSPTLSSDIEELQADGYTIEYGTAGEGTYINRDEKRIVIDSNTTDADAVVQSLAHEVGHAVNPPNYVSHEGRTRDEFVDANTEESIENEAKAILYQTEIRAEILDAGGPDVGVSGARSADYIAIYEKYEHLLENGLPGLQDPRDIVVQEIAEDFGTNERPSTDPSVNYETYYSDAWGDIYDEETRGLGDKILDTIWPF